MPPEVFPGEAVRGKQGRNKPSAAYQRFIGKFAFRCGVAKLYSDSAVVRVAGQAADCLIGILVFG
jgi:hypothetical protein